MLTEAAGKLTSFADAAFAARLVGVDISPRHLGRLVHEIGDELAKKRDEKVILRRRRQLPERVATAPEVVAVEVDGGRLKTRAAGCGPGVHEAQNKEDKIACLVSLRSERHDQDPQPEPPESFLEPRRVQRLVRQMKGLPGEHPAEAAEPEEAVTPPPPSPPLTASPTPVVRTCVASMHKSRLFGPMVAAEAQERAFYRAQRRAFLGDGLGYNWSIHKAYFPDFVPVVDLLHVLCYLYLAAWAAGGTAAERWARYLGWLRACWQGQVDAVIEEWHACQARVGKPPEDEELKEFDPRRLVAEALSYLKNNRTRMDYPRYRKEGLPITSSLVESLVGEFNARVKGPQKFWNRQNEAGAETILQIRAAVLSGDDRLKRHFAERPGSPYRRKVG